ncbi:MAG TPA: FliH/SctL family protein [Pseudolabrys sp.]|nr:FliH/SctL family protein [Pseudolabrys sp.]
MKATAKYLFDEDFASGERPTITLVEHERRRADAESQAYRTGFAAGQEQAQQDTAQHIAASLAVIADGLGRLDGALTAIETRLETEAVEVAVAVAAKLAPALIAREPFVEISALATESFHHLVSTPHVAVRVSPSVYEAVKEKIEEIARSLGFEGRLAVTPDESLGSGDCRIEWADGGVIRNQAATASAVDEMVGRYISARSAPAA